MRRGRAARAAAAALPLSAARCGGVLLRPPSPPLGWNSFLYGNGSRTYGTPNVSELVAPGQLLDGFAATLMPHGYEYFCVDGGWSTNSSVDEWGRSVPDPAIYPELWDRGWGLVADMVHARGAKFGLWVTHGIVTGAVERRLPIKGTPYTADQIVVRLGTAGGLCDARDGEGCYGNDINVTAHETATPEECCGVCRRTPGCQAWSWNKPYPKKLCYAKYSCDGWRMDGTVSGYYGSGPAKPACSWMPNYNYKVNTSHPGARAFYASLVDQWAGWGVDLLKFDCIYGVNMQRDDIALFRDAVAAHPRPIVVSLSPQGGDVESLGFARDHATMARVTGDFHRNWHQAFAHFAAAAPVAYLGGAEHGFYLDMDMLPFGGEQGQPPDEPPYKNDSGAVAWRRARRSILTLWAMVQSPMLYSGDTRPGPGFPADLRAQLTAPGLLAARRDVRAGRQLWGDDETVVWAAASAADARACYVAVFNVFCGVPRKADPPCPGGDNRTAAAQLPVALLLRSAADPSSPAGAYEVADLWNASAPLGNASHDGTLTVSVEQFSAALLRLSPLQ